MATIMTAGNSEGTYGRCDGKCHRARGIRCACICGGRYHGVGTSEKAQEMLTKDWTGEEGAKLLQELRDQGATDITGATHPFLF